MIDCEIYKDFAWHGTMLKQAGGNTMIKSLSNLQVTRTGIRSQTSSNSSQVRPVTLELIALDS